jgi:hypothetical protein
MFRIFVIWLGVLAPGLLTAFSKQTAPKPQNGGALEHFYVVSMAVSDAAPFWFDYVTDVRQEGDNVTVRQICMALVDSRCPHSVTVNSHESPENFRM